MYIYIYIYTNTYTYIYIYREREREMCIMALEGADFVVCIPPSAYVSEMGGDGRIKEPTRHADTRTHALRFML